MSDSKGYESPGIAGSGAIATGLAAVSTTTADTILLARSEASAWRAAETITAAFAKVGGGSPSPLRGTPRPRADADLATTTSSLGIGDISDKAGVPRLYGLHVFTPVPRMALIEVCIPDGAESARERAMAWGAALGKT